MSALSRPRDVAVRKRLPRPGHRPAAPHPGRTALAALHRWPAPLAPLHHSPAAPGRCLQCAPDRQAAGSGTPALRTCHSPAAPGRCLQCAPDRQATGGQRDASAPHLRVARTILWTGNAPGLVRAVSCVLLPCWRSARAHLVSCVLLPCWRSARARLCAPRRTQRSPCAPRPLRPLPLLPCVLSAAVIRADTASCF